jgi:hypothetical protein
MEMSDRKCAACNESITSAQVGAYNEKGEVCCVKCTAKMKIVAPYEKPNQAIPVQPWLSSPFPLELTQEQESLVRLWAKDDRLWTTQDTVEFNLRVFTRAILTSDRKTKHPWKA